MPLTVSEYGDITFSSGRELDTNMGFIGLNPEGEIGEGYDTRVHWPENDWLEPEERLTVDDLEELSDMMIERWQKFKANLRNDPR